MLKQLSIAAGAGLALMLVATPPAEAAPRKAAGLANEQAVEVSASRRRYRHRHVRSYRYARPYRYARRYYAPRPYYYSYAPYYAYRPYYYRPYYGPRVRIGGPGFYFGFGGW